MYLVTGAAGFIGSVLAHTLHRAGCALVLSDDFGSSAKHSNWQGLESHTTRVHRHELDHWLSSHGHHLKGCFHLGARTDTTLQDAGVFQQLNTGFSQMIWSHCVRLRLPLVYASSAATYGNGQHGYSDSHSLAGVLQPLNPYGYSKHRFDLWALGQTQMPPFWAGLKFFNVYGPNEYHKGRMASVVWHTVQQVQQTGTMRLFRSHKQGIPDGHQARDFIHVSDVVSVCRFLMEQQPASGLYNVGTGTARTFLDLVQATFAALNRPMAIEWADTPMDIRSTYQYFTEADVSKLRSAGYRPPFMSLEQGVSEYVGQYLNPLRYF